MTMRFMHEAHRSFDRLLLRLQLKFRIAADNFLGLGERPSVTLICPPESRTRVLCAVGASPPLPRMVPALTASSLSIAMASMNSLGGGPDFSACLTNIMNRIVISPFYFRL